MPLHLLELDAWISGVRILSAPAASRGATRFSASADRVEDSLILDIHMKLKRWAEWYISPVGSIFPSSSGTIEQKIREGRGMILPGIPKGSGRPGVRVDHVASRVDRAVARLSRSHQRVVRVFYLGHGTVERRARSLGMDERKLYRKIDLIHKHLARLLADG